MTLLEYLYSILKQLETNPSLMEQEEIKARLKELAEKSSPEEIKQCMDIITAAHHALVTSQNLILRAHYKI
jgi:Golgi nucleoside diphosphatase